MHVSIFQGIKLVFRKEFVTGLRFKAAWAAMFMFAFTTLACVSMALQGGGLDPRLQAALLWVILFFASMAGADRVFCRRGHGGNTAGITSVWAVAGSAAGQDAVYVLFAGSAGNVYCTTVSDVHGLHGAAAVAAITGDGFWLLGHCGGRYADCGLDYGREFA